MGLSLLSRLGANVRIELHAEINLKIVFVIDYEDVINHDKKK